ncbi:hypothetical protein [Vagococcus salmoninarum]|uniref:hypothetical protein n=1 Tax=Vagococcus salmoninarum TaxID=2739 RepID=UPI0028D6E8BF|nr:hypothetical protein [Vagococcus salmoninarum]
MNFTNLKNLVFNQLHTWLFLIGCFLVIVAIVLLVGMEWGVLATGILLILVALIIDKTT